MRTLKGPGIFLAQFAGDKPPFDTLDNMATYTKSLRAKARDEYDRDISTMTYGLVVVRDTEQEAKQAFQSVIDHGDWDVAGNVMKVAGMVK